MVSCSACSFGALQAQACAASLKPWVWRWVRNQILAAQRDRGAIGEAFSTQDTRRFVLSDFRRSGKVPKLGLFHERGSLMRTSLQIAPSTPPPGGDGLGSKKKAQEIPYSSSKSWGRSWPGKGRGSPVGGRMSSRPRPSACGVLCQ